MPGKLYIVDVWVGHWDDVTLRALRVLEKVRLIVTACTERVQELLERRGIHIPVLDIGQVEASATLDTLGAIVGALQDGDVAWVSGGATEWTITAQRLVRALLEQGCQLVSVPGPWTVIAGLVTSGLPADRFTFLGALTSCPQERRALLQRVAREGHTLVCRLSATCLANAVDDARAVLGDRRIAIHSERHAWRGLASQVPPLPKDGDYTLIIEGAERGRAWTDEQVRDQVRTMLQAGGSPRDVARVVASRSGWPRRVVYKIVTSTDRSD